MEKWTQWKPLPNLAKRYYIDMICEDHKGLKVVLSEFNDETTELHVTFDDVAALLIKTDESFIGSIISNLHERYREKFYRKWTFFKVENSRYIKLLSEQSYTISDHYSLTHFALIAGDSILDIVISDDNPKVEFVKK